MKGRVCGRVRPVDGCVGAMPPSRPRQPLQVTSHQATATSRRRPGPYFPRRRITTIRIIASPESLILPTPTHRPPLRMRQQTVSYSFQSVLYLTPSPPLRPPGPPRGLQPHQRALRPGPPHRPALPAGGDARGKPHQPQEQLPLPRHLQVPQAAGAGSAGTAGGRTPKRPGGGGQRHRGCWVPLQGGWRMRLLVLGPGVGPALEPQGRSRTYIVPAPPRSTPATAAPESPPCIKMFPIVSPSPVSIPTEPPRVLLRLAH